MQLGLLDTGFPTGAMRPQDSLRRFVQRAARAEELGYDRYWLSEHHFPAFVTPAWEILATHVAGATQRIRVGAGGALLPYHAPYRLACTVQTLSTLFPGRIDVAVGRGPGAAAGTQRALADDPAYAPSYDAYARKARDFAHFLRGDLPPTHPFRSEAVLPRGGSPPEHFTLGASAKAAQLAVELRTSFAYGMFLVPYDPMLDAAREVAQAYAQRPGTFAIAIMVLLAKSAKDAERVEEERLRNGSMRHNVVGTARDFSEEVRRIRAALDPDLLILNVATDVPLEQQEQTVEIAAAAFQRHFGAAAAPTVARRRSA